MSSPKKDFKDIDVKYSKFKKQYSEESGKLSIGESNPKLAVTRKFFSLDSAESNKKEKVEPDATETGYDGDTEGEVVHRIGFRKKSANRTYKSHNTLPVKESSSDTEYDHEVTGIHINSDASSDLTSDSSDGTLDLIESEVYANEFFPLPPDMTPVSDFNDKNKESPRLLHI